MVAETSESIPKPGESDEEPEQQRPDCSNIMAPREINGSGLESVSVRPQSLEIRPNFKEGGSLDRDGMNLQTSQKSVDRRVIEALQRSKEARMQQQLQLVEMK